MGTQTFGPRRCRASSKPQCQSPEPVFWRCAHCGAMFQTIGGEGQSNSISCCNQFMEELIPIPVAELPREMELDYKIVGSFNENAVQVFWNEAGYRPEWLYLKTFTGGQIKYLSDKKHPPVVFALADEDAYAYCDKDPCVECTFRCKRGFVLYGWSTSIGLAKLPLERMALNGRIK